MEALVGLLTGFGVIMTPANLYLCFLGSLIGTLVGVLPGVGPLAALALLLPVTCTLSPVGGMVMLASIFYGAMYGGSAALDPAEYSRRGRFGRDLHRRSSDGKTGARRCRARHRSDWFLCRGHAGRHRDDVLRAGNRGGCHSLRPAREFCADGSRGCLHALHDHAFSGQGRTDDSARISHCHSRN